MLSLCMLDGAESADLAGRNILALWSWPLLPLITICVSCALYLRGWSAARLTRAQELPPWRMWCFLAGMGVLWVALTSPIDALDDYLLSVHMLQHFLLMSVIPPLIALSAPAVPMMRGLPGSVVQMAAPLFRWRWLRRVMHVAAAPAVAWIAMNLAYVGWHVPGAFEATFRSETTHDLEHACFLLTSLMYWWVVISPWPSRARWSRWAVILYLLSADVVNTALSASIAFAGKVVYPWYSHAERICALSPLQDQVAAGAGMWVMNSLVFLIPAVALTVKQLSPQFLADAAAARE